jgi:NADPH:quinone reductase-like Zn-dependent oxidoreductase
MPVPEGLSLAEAASLPEALCTVWSNLVMTAHLAGGESLLIHGGASGIGTMAIQVARHRGAVPLVTVGSAHKAARCRELGAEQVVNYRTDDFVAVVRAATDGAGVDVVLEIVGAKYLDSNLRALARDGRLVVIGLQGGAKAELDLGQLLRKRGAVIATSLRARPADEKAAIVAAVRDHVWPLVESVLVKPVVHGRHPLAAAAEAHRELEASGHIGKILLTV